MGLGVVNYPDRMDTGIAAGLSAQSQNTTMGLGHLTTLDNDVIVQNANDSAGFPHNPGVPFSTPTDNGSPHQPGAPPH